jgi:archaellum component FlaC
MKNYKFLIFIFFLVVNSCSKQDEINQLNQTILDLQSNISQLNSRINEFSSQISLLTNQNNDLTNQNNDLTNQLGGAQVQMEDLANQLNGLQAEIENYLNQIEVLNDQNLLLDFENNNLTNQLTELKDQIDLIQAQGAEDGVYIFNQIEISDPPFSGTMWDLPDLIKSSDYTVYSSSTYQGILDRLFYDKSIPDFITYPAHVYKVNFGDDLSVDFEIYSEFTQEEASNLEQKYAPLMGQLGKELRKNIKSIEFLKGEEVASAQRSNDLSYANITFHTDWLNNIVETRTDGDRTEELFIHEAAHLSIDPYVYGQQGWTDAVNLDGNYLSTYAKENPESEDIAETFQAYIAVKYFPERITSSLRDTILSICLNRFKYFDSLNLDLSIYK